jgi:iron-sulfur cluster assembly protein
MATGVSITDHAVEKIKQRLAAEKREGQGLRVKVVGGGCSGLQNKLDFDTSRAGDKVFEKDGAKVLVDIKSLLYLNGTELDYKEGLMQSGFALQNPNVKRSCGCGVSFTVCPRKGAWFQKVVPLRCPYKLDGANT